MASDGWPQPPAGRIGPAYGANGGWGYGYGAAAFQYLTPGEPGQYVLKMASRGSIVLTALSSGICGILGLALVVVDLATLVRDRGAASPGTAALFALVAVFLLAIAALPWLTRRQTIFDQTSRMIVAGQKTYPFDSFTGFRVFRSRYLGIPMSTVLQLQLRREGTARPKYVGVKRLGPGKHTQMADACFAEIAAVMGLVRQP